MHETFVPHNFIVTIQNALNKGSQPWFAKIFISALTSGGAVSSWIHNSDNVDRFRKFYHYIQRLGVRDETIQNAYAA